MALVLMQVVGRAKKCLDFTATAYILHFLVVLAYDGFPTIWEWWVINVISLIATVVVGEILCMRRELREIPSKETGIELV